MLWQLCSYTTLLLVLCVVSAQCSIEAQAYSANDNLQTKRGYLKLNGVAVWQASWRGDGEYPNDRGANMFVVDTSTCTLRESRRFDTSHSRGAAAHLRDYIQGLSNGTVLVGVSADEASSNLDAAEATLSRLGADVSDVKWRGAWVFVAEIGDPLKTVLDKELTETAANARQPYVNVSFAAGEYNAMYHRSISAELIYLDEIIIYAHSLLLAIYRSWFVCWLSHR